MSCQEAVAHPDQVRIQLTTPGRMSGRVKKTLLRGVTLIHLKGG
jgi:hypothetical protein